MEGADLVGQVTGVASACASTVKDMAGAVSASSTAIKDATSAIKDVALSIAAVFSFVILALKKNCFDQCVFSHSALAAE